MTRRKWAEDLGAEALGEVGVVRVEVPRGPAHITGGPHSPVPAVWRKGRGWQLRDRALILAL